MFVLDVDDDDGEDFEDSDTDLGPAEEVGGVLTY